MDQAGLQYKGDRLACPKGLQTSMKDKLGRWRYCRRVMADTKAVCGEGRWGRVRLR